MATEHANLFKAATEGDLEYLKSLLENQRDDTRGSIVNTPDEKGNTLLHIACTEGHLDIVKYLPMKEDQLGKVDNEGRTPLHLASWNGHLDVVQFLVSKGAQIEEGDNAGSAPLHIASWNGHLNVVQFLVSKGAHIEKVDDAGNTPLHEASCNGHLDVVRFLVSKGAQIEKGDNAGSTPLHKAPCNGHLNVVQFLVSKGAQIEKGDNAGITTLHKASWYGQLDVVRYLISKGAHIDQGCSDGRTPLHFAAHLGYLDVVQFLVSKGAQIEKGDNTGSTPLHKASGNGHLDVVQFLVSKGGQVDKPADDDKTPLHHASLKGHLAVAEFLVSEGAEITKRDIFGTSPFHLATFNCLLDDVDFLVSDITLDQSEKVDSTRWTHRPAEGQHVFVDISQLHVRKSDHLKKDDTSTISGDSGFQTRSKSSLSERRNEVKKSSLTLPIRFVKRLWSRRPTGISASSLRKQESVFERIQALEERSDFSLSRYLEEFGDGMQDEWDASDQSQDVFGQRGGELTIPSHGLTLSIPPGALPEGVSERISVKILTDIPPEFTLRDDEMVVTNTFQCLPSGLHFAAEKAVRLTIPHCALLIDPQKVQAILYTWYHGNEHREPERIVLTSRTCQVTPHYVEVFLEHFSRGFLAFIIDWWYTSGKRMSFMPFLPREMPPLRNVMLELRMVNKPHGISWRDIHDFGKNGDHKPAKDDDDEMNVKDEDLKVSCQLNDNTPLEKKVSSNILQMTKHTVYFKLNFEGKADYLPVMLTLKQTVDEIEIGFITKFTEHTGGEKGRVLASSLTQDGVADQKLDKLSNCVPPGKYSEFCSLIGFGFNQADSILASNNKVYSKAVRECLGGWKDRTGGSLQDLKRVLLQAELKALMVHIEQ